MVFDMNSSVESDWAWLPKNLLDVIIDKLDSQSDYVRFGGVCKPWRFVAMENKVKYVKNKCYTQVPLLMVPTKDNSEERRSLYNITNNKIYDFQLRVPYKKRCCGSSYGWLFTVEENMGVTLLNPFSGSTIGLPPIKDVPKFEEEEEEDEEEEEEEGEEEDEDDDDDDEEDKVDRSDEPPFYEYLIYKAILSADPAFYPDDYVVTAIYDDRQRLAFFQSGDQAWTYLEDQRFDLIQDVIYYKGQIFTVNYWGRVIMIDVNSRDGATKAPQAKIIAPRTRVHADLTYLVESSNGDLLIVRRFMKEIGDDLQHETSGFKVFKLLLPPNMKGYAKRIRVKSLGGDTMFLGDSHSTCISASKFFGCQPNSIYYTDNYYMFLAYPPYGRRDIGIFNVEDGSFGTHYILDPLHRVTPPAIWIVPTVLGN